MSGGIAYVLDEDGDFAERCNLSMVDLEPVAEEDELLERLHHHGGDLEFKGRIDVMADMSGFDAERLMQLIANHLQLHRLDAGQAHPRQLGRLPAALREGDAGRIPPRACSEIEQAQTQVAAE